MHTQFVRFIGVNISERNSGTEWTTKREKREFIVFPTTRGRNWYCSTSSTPYTDFSRSTITRDIFNPGPTRNNQAKTHNSFTVFNFAERISFAEHRKLVAESSEFHLIDAEQSA